MGAYKIEVDISDFDVPINLPFAIEFGEEQWWEGGNPRVRNAGFEWENLMDSTGS